MGVLLFAAVIVGGLAVFHANKVSQARHDVQFIALALDGFARENGDYPKGTPGEICRMLRGETVNGQNPKKLDYVEAQPGELNGLGEFVDPWERAVPDVGQSRSPCVFVRSEPHRRTRGR